MLEVAWSLGAYIVAIGVLVSFHEFGHYWVARRLGIKVLRFSIGFGKPIWIRLARDGVEWAISAIPLGGYVKMLDEREGIVAPAERHLAFNQQSPVKRIAVVMAGPLFNFLLATIFYWTVLVSGVTDLKPLLAAPAENSTAAHAGLAAGDEVLKIGDARIENWTQLRMAIIDQALTAGSLRVLVRSPQNVERTAQLPLAHVRNDPEFLFNDIGLAPYQPEIPPVLKEITAGGSAAVAGFKAGDRLLSFNDHALHSFQEWRTWVRAHAGEVVSVRLKREQQELTLQVIIASQVQDGKTVGVFGAVGVDPSAELWNNLRAEYRLDPIAAVPAAMKQTWQMSALTLKLLYRMVLGDVSVKNISGPIQIAQIAGYSASDGLVSFLRFLAIISLSLGVLNLMPVPVLDGGHLLYYVVELVKGSPLSERAQAIGQQVGLTLLVALMGLAFYNDIMRLIS